MQWTWHITIRHTLSQSGQDPSTRFWWKYHSIIFNSYTVSYTIYYTVFSTGSYRGDKKFGMYRDMHACTLCLFYTVIYFNYLQTKEDPTAGLMKYLEQQQEGYSIAQLQELLQIAYNKQPRENINETFVKVESIVLWKLCLSVSLVYMICRHF